MSLKIPGVGVVQKNYDYIVETIDETRVKLTIACATMEDVHFLLRTDNVFKEVDLIYKKVNELLLLGKGRNAVKISEDSGRSYISFYSASDSFRITGRKIEE